MHVWLTRRRGRHEQPLVSLGDPLGRRVIPVGELGRNLGALHGVKIERFLIALDRCPREIPTRGVSQLFEASGIGREEHEHVSV